MANRTRNSGAIGGVLARLEDEREPVGRTFALAAEENPYEHLAKAIRGATIKTVPFPYIYVRSVFPAALYEEMERAIPDEAAWSAAGVYAPHFEVPLHRTTLEPLRTAASAWTDRYIQIVQVLHESLLQKFRRLIDRQLRRYVRLGLIDEPMPLIPGQSIFCQRPAGWYIAPHSHNAYELLQTLVYFPVPGSPASLGTTVYETLPDVPIDRTVLHRDRSFAEDEIRDPVTLPYERNSLFSFLTSPLAAHAAMGTDGHPPRRYLFTKAILPPGVISTAQGSALTARDFRLSRWL